MKRFIKVFLIMLFFLTFHAAMAQPTAPEGKKWVKVDVLSDEFNGNSLDLSKWQPKHPYWSGRSPSQFNEANSSVSNGNLQLKSTIKNSNFQGDWVWSACVTSNQKSMKPGYYSEARVKCSKLSMTTSFWFQEPSKSEIDVIENFGDPSSEQWDQNKYYMATNTHYFPNGFGGPGYVKTPWNKTDLPVSVGEQYYTYGVWWKDFRTVIFYLDGQEVHTTTTGGDFDKDMYMFFDTEVFSWGIGHPKLENLGDDSKNTGYVDWVHTYKLDDDDGTVDVQSAFTSHKIPGIIQAEDYDNGGQGLAYNDADATNNGGEGRTDQGVDLEVTTDEGGGANVGWISNGEWLEYTIADITSGTYNINLRVASNNADPKSIKAFLGTKELGSISIVDTGGWQSWQDVIIPNVVIDDETANQVLRLEMTVSDGAFNVNWVSFIASTLSVTDVDTIPFKLYPNPSNGEVTIEAKDERKALSLIIYDVMGRQILAKKSDNHNIKLSGLSSGLYWVQLNQGSKQTSKKLIIL